MGAGQASRCVARVEDVEIYWLVSHDGQLYASRPRTLSIPAFASAPRRASPLASRTLRESESADAPSRGRIACGQSHGDDVGK
ncbi:hypothetical protein ACRE_044560 [Hapsidospora chrysogenum ATCC 11550]|uniref:Uncharacterized protein n=1 Tax=Hapsidospora chrysogenum (strain ATCC 11550 / CBS 779.69 / DSM 880 / IAM 14645 / JCM 23072 / IMI 49137) TaxID=857340 RepID=A0A086T5U7_HAPC1|nr:hypothetical protein ACRE_044560 [Hapsidospora chrysogenum ATCC 11550]